MDRAVTGSLYEHFIGQIRGVLRGVGQSSLEQTIGDSVNLDPAELARMLIKVFGADCACVVDNCEALLDNADHFDAEQVMRYVRALATGTKWHFLFTSRETFTFGREGREPHPVRWIEIEELLPTERAHLLSLASGSGEFNFGDFTEEDQQTVFTEIAGHPYELNLFIQAAKGRDDLNALIDEIHRITSRYARLDYYIGRHSVAHRAMLQLVALLDQPLEEKKLSFIWKNAQKQKLETTLAAKQLLSDLKKNALLVESDGAYDLLPVLRHHLLRGESSFRPTSEERKQLHHLIVKVFYAHFEQATQVRSEALSKKAEDGDRVAAWLSRERIDMLHRAFRHSWHVGDLESSCALLEELSDQAAGLLSRHSLCRYAVMLRDIVDALDEEEWLPLHAIVYGVTGKVLAGLRMFDEAISVYGKSIKLAKATGDDSSLGVTYHLLGRVFEKQDEWVKAAKIFLLSLKNYLQYDGNPNELIVVIRSCKRILEKTELTELSTLLDQLFAANPELAKVVELSRAEPTQSE